MKKAGFLTPLTSMHLDLFWLELEALSLNKVDLTQWLGGSTLVQVLFTLNYNKRLFDCWSSFKDISCLGSTMFRNAIIELYSASSSAAHRPESSCNSNLNCLGRLLNGIHLLKTHPLPTNPKTEEAPSDALRIIAHFNSLVNRVHWCPSARKAFRRSSALYISMLRVTFILLRQLPMFTKWLATAFMIQILLPLVTNHCISINFPASIIIILFSNPRVFTN